MQNEMIAVLLSAYNGERYIRPQVESILQQDVDCELTLIIRDDGSSDNTVEIIKKLSQKDNRIVLLKGENCGVNRSFFELIRYASKLPGKYKYFSLADQDDVWDADKLQNGINVIRSLGVGHPILYGSISRPVDENLVPIERTSKKNKPITFYNSIIQNFVAGHTQIMNRELLMMVKDVDATKLHGHDAFIVNVAVLGGDLYYDKVPHASYRQHSGNQLGTSNSSRIDWVSRRLARIKKGDAVKYATQIEYIQEYCKDLMSQEQYDEVTRFLECRKNFFKRLGYIATKKVYRQERFDDIAFCLLYLLGGYNT